MSDLSTIQSQKEKISSLLFDTLEAIQGVISTTIVGSFNDREELLMISDIDTIVIVEKLNESVFNECIKAISDLPGEGFGFPEREVYVNSTFGPLKFDTESNIVVHLMIYDLEGHRNHVIKSPFTCYDWERSQMNRGPSLEELYPVQKLQPSDFTGMRRGIQNYLEDLERGSISYRKYEFENDKVKEVTLDHQLDARHQGEFAFHIVKNLVLNYSKLIEQRNLRFDDESLERYWKKHLPLCREFILFYKEISVIKLKRELEFPKYTVTKVKNFIETFSKQLEHDWGDTLNLDWVRHGKTEYNDGSFLGQSRDPGLLEQPHPTEVVYDAVYSSPLKRAEQTAMAFVPNTKLSLKSELCEINYGDAEGLHFPQLEENYPQIVQQWSEGLDPKFPKGENTEDVLKRVQAFLKEQESESGIKLVVSHNVVIRCLLGYLYQIDVKDWFKIPVQHLEEHRVMYHQGRFYLNLTRDQKARIIDAMVSWLN